LSGGKALLDIINRRADPIPFYGELSSLNPVIVTPAAVSGRGETIGTELVASFTLGVTTQGAKIATDSTTLLSVHQKTAIRRWRSSHSRVAIIRRPRFRRIAPFPREGG